MRYCILISVLLLSGCSGSGYQIKEFDLCTKYEDAGINEANRNTYSSCVTFEPVE